MVKKSGFVGVGDWAQDFAGISDGYYIRWDISGNDTARTDDRIIADFDSRQDDDICAEPDVIADFYRS